MACRRQNRISGSRVAYSARGCHIRNFYQFERNMSRAPTRSSPARGNCVQEAFQRHGCGVPMEPLNDLGVGTIQGQECDARLTEIVEADVAEGVFRSLILGAHRATATRRWF